MGLLRSSLVSLGALVPVLVAGAEPAMVGESLTWVRFSGGDLDDHAFAQAAAGLRAGKPLPPGELEVALAAIRATDRFSRVSGNLQADGGRMGCRIALEPWPLLEGWEWAGDGPAGLRKSLFPELRKGIRVGEARREQWRSRAETQLRGTGYPEAKVNLESIRGGRQLLIRVDCGPSTLVKHIQIAGRPGPYSIEKLRKIVGLKTGTSLWHAEAARAARVRLRERFLKDRRYEWKAELAFDAATGTLTVQVDPGPVVSLRILGSGLGWWSRPKELLPLARAESYSPELMGEGERRILRLLRSRGYLDAQVSSMREVIKPSPEEIRVTYMIQSGPRYRLHNVRFERNAEVPSEQLQKALEIPRRWLFFGDPLLTPDLIGGVEDQLKGYYAVRGYTDVSLRRPPMEREGKDATLVIQVREGNARIIRRMELRVVPELALEAPGMAELLTASFADHPFKLQSVDPSIRIYRSDRSALEKVTATLRPIPGESGAFSLDFSRPVPLVKRDLAQILYLVHQRLVALGVQRPLENLKLVEGEGGAVVRIDVPLQATEQIRRVVIKGADKTRAKAFLRESLLEPGAPLDPERVVRTQARVANLGAFDRVDLFSLAEDKPEGAPWKPGDLALNVQERSPWVITNSFGYDRAQGYHIGTGIQRLNVGGMGRTLDFGLRAGDGTINNPGLRKVFPTGDSPRSVDMYSLGYTDPWFAPWGWLPKRTQFREEGAYIFERRDSYEIRRLRLLTSLEWRKGDHLLFQVGHRFERVSVEARAIGDLNAPTLSDAELNRITRSPSHSIISAPYFQVIRDTRDNPFDPTRGQYSVGRVELATQFLGTSPNSSFIKADLRHQWTWPVGPRASAGVAMLGMRMGMAHPTASTAEDLPLSERFFGGGPFSQRGVEPDWLGPRAQVTMTTSSGAQVQQWVALGGQGLALVNAEYRFPVVNPIFWGEVFVDSGQVYAKLNDKHHDPFRTSLGIGAILKVGFPIKIEYAVDMKRIMGKPRTQDEKDTQLKNLLISAGFQF